MKIKLGLILISSLLSSLLQAGIIHNYCKDQTYAYNVMSLTESKNQINFYLEGATIFKLVNNQWDGLTETNFGIDKSKCNFSSDKLLLRCNSDEAIIIRSNSSFFGSQNNEILRVSDLIISIEYIEFAGGFFEKAFVLKSSYKIENKAVSNKTYFQGERINGCKK